MKIKPVYILLALMAIMGVEMIYMAIQKKKLEYEVEKLRFILYTPGKAALNDRSLPVFAFLEFTDIATGKIKGFSDMVDKDSAIVFVFSTDCYACDKSSEQWNAVYDEFASRFTIFGISKSDRRGIENYVMRNNVRFPVFQYESPQGADFFDAVPATIFADKTGNVTGTIDGIPIDLKNKIN